MPGLKCSPPSRDSMLVSHHLAQGFSRFTSKYNAFIYIPLYLQKEGRFRVPLGPVGWDLMGEQGNFHGSQMDVGV